MRELEKQGHTLVYRIKLVDTTNPASRVSGSDVKLPITVLNSGSDFVQNCSPEDVEYRFLAPVRRPNASMACDMEGKNVPDQPKKEAE